MHANDVAKCIVECIKKEGLGALNVGTGTSLSLLDLYKTLEHYEKNRLLELNETTYMPDKSSRIPDCSKLHKYEFRFDLENSVKEIKI